MTRSEVYFGLSRPNGANVSDSEFQQFVNSEIATRFPDGFTVLSAEGHWREADGKVVAEPSRLLILLGSGQHDQQLVDDICRVYRDRFDQEAVLKVTSRADVQFVSAPSKHP